MKQVDILFLLFANLFCLTQQQNCWTPYTSSQSYGGSPINSVPSLSSCQIICQSTPGCKAIEWLDGAPGVKCFLFYTSDPPSYAGRSGIDHYISTCTCNWITYDGKQSFGGVPSQATDLDKCKNACYYNSTCRAIEWVSGENKCYLFSNDAIPTNNAVGISHYIFKCDQGQWTTAKPPGSCSWVPQSNKGTSSGKLQNNINNLDDCKFVCVQTDGCKLGLDWHESLKQCWLSTTSTSYSNSGLTHYDYTCSSNIVSWNLASNMNSRGGIVQPTAQSLDDCKAICQDWLFCIYGFDWDNLAALGQQCWISTRFNLTNANGVDHYAPERGLTPTPGDISECTWYSYPNSNSPLGIKRADLTNLTICQKECRKTNCKGIDWDPQGVIKCWFSQTDIVLINSYPGVTHYNYTCPGGSTTSTLPSLVTKLGPDCDYIMYVNSGSEGGQVTTQLTKDDCRNQCTVRQNCKAYEWRSTKLNNCVFYDVANPPVYNGNIAGYTFYLFKKCL